MIARLLIANCTMLSCIKVAAMTDTSNNCSHEQRQVTFFFAQAVLLVIHSMYTHAVELCCC
jgi:hypothetical protein